MENYITKKTKYDYKIVKCGEYLQVYYYPSSKTRKSIKDIDINDLSKKQIKFDFGDIESLSSAEKENIIESKNIIRTKLACQRLAKCNSREWKSFITLTYSDNMQDIKQAKTDLYYFTKNIQKKKKDFKYIAIPEFQKRGAIHFHLLTNLSVQDNYIIKPQKDNNKYYDVAHWCKGFTSYEEIEGDIKKIIGYIAKYMTKECDSRLFGIRRYTSSQNLVKPIEEFIDIESQRHTDYLIEQLEDKEEIYKNSYQDNLGNEVIFKEYKQLKE